MASGVWVRIVYERIDWGKVIYTGNLYIRHAIPMSRLAPYGVVLSFLLGISYHGWVHRRA